MKESKISEEEKEFFKNQNVTLSYEKAHCENLLKDDEDILKKQTEELQTQKNDSAQTLIAVFYEF